MHQRMPTSPIPEWLALLRESSLASVSPTGATLDTLVAHSSDACLVLDLDGRILDVNQRAEQVLQRSRAAMLGQWACDVLPTACTTRFVVAFHRLLTEGVPMQDETYGPYLGRWIAIRAFHIERGVAVVLRDVTERHHGQAATAHDLLPNNAIEETSSPIEPRHPEIFEHTHDGVVVLNLQAGVIATNAVFAAMLGYAAAALIGRSLVEMVVVSDRATTMDHFHAVLRGDTAPVIMPTLTTAHNHTVSVQIDSTLVRDAHGAPLYVRSVFRAAGEPAHAEYPQQESAVWLRSIMESLGEGLLITDEHDVVLYANGRVTELTGYASDDLLGKPMYTLLLPPDEWPVGLGNDQRRISGVTEQYEMPLLCKDGNRRWININAAPLRNSAGEVVATLGVITDIDEHKRMERRSAAFSALGQQLSSATTAVEAARIIATAADDLIGWDAYSLLLYNATDNTLQSILDVDLINGARQEMHADGAVVTPGPLTQRTLVEGPLLLLPEQAQVELSTVTFGDEDRASASLMFVPIKRDEHNIGVLTIQSYTPHAYTAADLDTLQALADHCSGALERIRAEAQHTRVAQQHAAFSALGQRLSSATTTDAAARIIATVADDLLGWDAYSLLLYNADTDLVSPVLNMDIVNGVRQEAPLVFEGGSPGSLSRRALEYGPQLLLPEQPVVDVEDFVPFGDEDRASASLMFVPIKRDEHNIGVLTIQSYTPHAYTAADLDTLQALADHCGGALERIRAEAALRSAEARYRDMVENASDMIYVHDLRGTILSVNAAVERLTGYTRAELIGKNAARFVAPEALPLVRAAFNLKIGELHHVKPFEIEIVCKDGARLPVEISARLVRADDTVVALEGIARDMRERKRAEAIIRHMAFYDTLTNLPNRVLFDEYLRHALALATQHHTALAVLFVDLDRFKLINDALGHHTGDLLLEAVPQRLLGCVRPGDTVARMGGDEFTVLLPNITSTDDAALVAQRLLDALTAPFTIGGHELFVSASIGISVFPADGGDAETLLKHADTAMYRAKEGGRSGYQFYTPAMNAATHKQHQLEQRLRRALERDEFRLVYQPRIDPHTGALLGAEALLRWQHPEFGLIGPADFIGVAEDTGLIMPIGLWVLRTACQQAKAWRQTGAPLRMAVNLSARQFQHTNLAAQVAAVLADTGLPAHALELEITESMAMHNAERTVVVLRALKELGVHLSVDDFGTGYSSLSYLKQFDVDTLKIDRGFVCDLPHDSAIAEAVLALAHSLSMSVTAEGVETEEQLAFLQQHNCDEVQGFLIGKPVPADQFAPLFMQGNKVIRRHGAIGTR